MDRKDQVKIFKYAANGALLIGFISVIYERINPGTSVPYILMAIEGLMSIIGFIYMIIYVDPIKPKSGYKD